MYSQGTVQIFFPRSQANKKGYLVGFNISGFQTTVILIQNDSDLQTIENILTNSKRLNNISSYCGSKMVVLGRIYEKGDTLSEYCEKQMKTYDPWIDIEFSAKNEISKQLKIKTLLSFGYTYKTKAQIIFYDEIQKNSLLSINPKKVKEVYSSFDIPQSFAAAFASDHSAQSSSATTSAAASTAATASSANANIAQTQSATSETAATATTQTTAHLSSAAPTSSQSINNQDRLKQYYQSHIDVHDFDLNLKYMETMEKDIFNVKPFQNLSELDYIIKQINLSNLICSIYRAESSIALTEQPSKESEQKSDGNAYESWLKPNGTALMLISIIVKCSCVQRLFYSFMYMLLNSRIPWVNRTLFEMKFGCNVFNQVKFKLEVMQSWPILLRILKDRTQSVKYSFVLKIYLRLLSGLAYIAVDTFLGLLSILVISLYSSSILAFIHNWFSGIHIDVLSKEVEWLMSDPAGLKTNKNLNKILGFLVSNIFVFWNHFTTATTEFEPYLIQLLAFFGLFGISFELCIVNDIVNVLTLHIYVIYKTLMLIYREIVSLIKILFGVMRGKKTKLFTREVSFDIKYLSMIFFFLLISMCPTIIMYYFAYLLIVVVIYLIKVALNSAIHILNTFPLFMVVTYFTQKDLFPELCLVTLRDHKQLNDQAIFHLEKKKISIGVLLSGFNSKISKFFKKVNLGKLLKFSISGMDILVAVEQNKQSKRTNYISELGHSESLTCFSIKESLKYEEFLSKM